MEIWICEIFVKYAKYAWKPMYEICSKQRHKNIVNDIVLVPLSLTSDVCVLATQSNIYITVEIKDLWFEIQESISWSHEPKIHKISIFHESLFFEIW